MWYVIHYTSSFLPASKNPFPGKLAIHSLKCCGRRQKPSEKEQVIVNMVERAEELRPSSCGHDNVTLIAILDTSYGNYLCLVALKKVAD